MQSMISFVDIDVLRLTASKRLNQKCPSDWTDSKGMNSFQLRSFEHFSREWCRLFRRISVGYR